MPFKLPRLILPKLSKPSRRRSRPVHSKPTKTGFQQPVYIPRSRSTIKRHKSSRNWTDKLRGWLKFKRTHGRVLTQGKIMAGGIFLASVIIGGLYYLLVPAQIICRIDQQPCSSEIINRLADYRYQPVLLYLYHLEDDLFNQFPFLVATRINYSLHRQLQIDLQTIPPDVALTTERLSAESQYFLVNRDGLIQRRVSQTNLPLITVDQLSAVPGQKISRHQHTAVNLVYHLHRIGHRFTATQTAPDTLTIHITGKPITIQLPLNDQQTVNQLVSALQLILTQTTMDDQLTTIDLRFSKPIIRVPVTPTPTPDPDQSASVSDESNNPDEPTGAEPSG